MPEDVSKGRPTTRRYSEEEKAAAVRMVRALRAELGVRLGGPALLGVDSGRLAECVGQPVAPDALVEGEARGQRLRLVRRHPLEAPAEVPDQWLGEQDVADEQRDPPLRTPRKRVEVRELLGEGLLDGVQDVAHPGVHGAPAVDAEPRLL